MVGVIVVGVVVVSIPEWTVSIRDSSLTVLIKWCLEAVGVVVELVAERGCVGGGVGGCVACSYMGEGGQEG